MEQGTDRGSRIQGGPAAATPAGEIRVTHHVALCACVPMKALRMLPGEEQGQERHQCQGGPHVTIGMVVLGHCMLDELAIVLRSASQGGASYRCCPALMRMAKR